MAKATEICPNCGCPIDDHRFGGIGVCKEHACEDTRLDTSIPPFERRDKLDSISAFETLQGFIEGSGVSPEEALEALDYLKSVGRGR